MDINNNINNNIGILDPQGINLNPLTEKPYSDDYKKLADTWSKFPAYKRARDIIQDIQDNQIILVISGTGSGKTVLFPKYLLHVFNYNSRIAITLPKQIIAKSAAEFAAKTLDVELGKEVGYKYKGSDRKASSDTTKLLYATDGTIVQQLLKDPLLLNFQGVIIDEAHERKIQIDFLLYLLRNTAKFRPDFKLIIMSATIDEKLFESYFYNFKLKTIFIGSLTNYPIKSIFLDKPINEKEYLKYGFDIIKKITDNNKNNDNGNILFFVTSVNETQTVCDMVRSNINSDICIEVFAGMNKELNKKDNETDKRNIYIATNVAESSLTIEGIKYVIDSGYELFNYYDPQLRAKVLEKKLISQAQAIQRKGRAGRTGPGICYHLYTKDDFENRMKKFPEPSIRTSNIYSECLQFLHLPNVRNIGNLLQILTDFIEPPHEIYIRSAITQLTQLGLIFKEEISELGDVVAELKMDPMEGVAIVLGYRLKCAREIAAIFSILNITKNSIRELFHKPSNMRNVESAALKKINDRYMNSKKELSNKYGDHLSILKIFILYTEHKKKSEQSLNDWCYKHFIKRSVLDRSQKNYNKTRNNIRNVMSKSNFNFKFLSDMNSNFGSEELNNLKLEYKILLCIAYGFRLNVGKMKYRINRDSFMNYKNLSTLKNNIVYNELFSNNGKLELNIVSELSKNIYKAFEQIL